MLVQERCHHPPLDFAQLPVEKSLSRSRDVNFILLTDEVMVNGSVSPMLSNPDMFSRYWSSGDPIVKLL